MEEILEFSLNNQDYKNTIEKVYNNDPDKLAALQLTQDNIDEMINSAVIKNASKCFQVLLKYQNAHQDKLNLNHAELLAKIITRND